MILGALRFDFISRRYLTTSIMSHINNILYFR